MLNKLQIVKCFASALDREDYALAASCLHPDSVYECRGHAFHGPDAIVASYRGNAEKATKFDAINYTSEVIAETDAAFRILFSDQITHGERQLTFQCEQRVELDDSGAIVRIEHQDLPGQLEALAEFKKWVTDHHTP